MAGELYGLIAEFDTPESLVAACERARDAGYRRMDAYAPFPVEGLASALGLGRTWIAPIVLAAGIAGGLGGYALQVYAMAIDYPLNVGGRPLHSWPAFIPITFELTVLVASVVGMLAMFALNGLPRLHHPIFSAPGFERASIDGFFLCVETADEKYSPEETHKFLESLGATTVKEVWEE